MFFLMLLLAFAAVDQAHAQAGKGNFELYLGYYFPDFTDEGEDELTAGVRGGYQWTDSLGLQGSVGRYTTDIGPFDIEATFVDLSLLWYANPDGRNQLLLYGGPGWAFLSADGNTLDDSLTAHVGLGAVFPLSEKLYLRPDARARWFEEGGDDLDLEVSLALGFKFGT